MDKSKSWQQCQTKPSWATGVTHGVTREGLIPTSWSILYVFYSEGFNCITYLLLVEDTLQVLYRIQAHMQIRLPLTSHNLNHSGM